MFKGTMKKAIPLLLVLLCALGVFSASAEATGPISVRALLLPKFEIGELAGDFPGEAQYYYEAFLQGGEAYDIPCGNGDGSLYVKDGVALCLTGMGKVNAALTTLAVLSDSRFDFSDAYVISTGCAGSAMGTTVMGDVFVITAAVDYDLGHHADIREMEDQSAETWFHDADFDDSALVRLDPELMDRVYTLVADVPLRTTERTRRYMLAAFDGAEWAGRDPRVLRGTTVTGDNYWKGAYDHRNALKMVETYDCPDPLCPDGDGGRRHRPGAEAPGPAGPLYHHPGQRKHGRLYERRDARAALGPGGGGIPGLRGQRGGRRHLRHRDGEQLPGRRRGH